MPHITDIAWCPGCGTHMLQKAVKMALDELNIEPKNFMMISGIGQAIKLSNRKLVIVAESSDDDMLGEEKNHFLDTIQRNADISVIIHNNMSYGLTRDKASSTSQLSTKTPAQGNGVKQEPFNPLGVALAMNAPFIARAFAGDVEQTKLMVMEAIAFKGFSVVDVVQPCVVFNKLNTCQWFKKNIHYLPKSHDTSDRNAAFRLVTGSDKLPLGVFFRHERRELYEDLMSIDPAPLFEQQQPDEKTFQMMIEACR